MARIPFTVLPISINDPSLPQLDPGDVELLGELEYGSQDHWILGGGQQSLTGLVAGTELTPMGEAPSYQANSLTIRSLKGHALETEFDAGINVTVALVYKSSGGSSTRAVFTGGAPNPLGTGYYMFHGSSQAIITEAIGLSPARQSPGYPVSGDWQFLAMSIRDGEVLVANGSTVQAFPVTGTVNKSNRNIALGASYHNITADVPLNFAEAIVFSRGLTASELVALHSRSAQRMSKRQISI